MNLAPRMVALAAVLGFVTFAEVKTATAAEAHYTMTQSDNNATVARLVVSNFDMVRKALLERDLLEKQIGKLSFFRKVDTFASADFKQVSRDETIAKFEATRTLMAFPFNDKVLAPMLLQVKIEETRCVTQKCAREISATISGPIHSYSNTFQYVNPEEIDGSITIKLKANEESDKTRVTMEGTIVNRKYIKLLKDLKEKGAIAHMPLESDLMKAFTIWSGQALKDLETEVAK